MRIIAWNVNHRTRAREIPPALTQGLAALSPDVVVLTEYVPGTDHETMCARFGALGFPFVHMSTLSAGHNQVVIASRSASHRGNIRLGKPAPNAECNFLHVHLQAEDMDIVGFRVPAYKNADHKDAYWRRFEARVRPLAEHRIVMAGDFNTHPGRKRCVGAEALHRLQRIGWQVETPAEGGSYYSRKGKQTPIDHALVGRSLRVRGARYVRAHAGYVFAGVNEDALSDHAVLEFEIVT